MICPLFKRPRRSVRLGVGKQPNVLELRDGADDEGARSVVACDGEEDQLVASSGDHRGQRAHDAALRFMEHDSTEENMRLLQNYLELNGRPVSFCTDKGTLFANLPKTKRGQTTGQDRPELPPTQIGRALKELNIEWLGAHSPQAKGRIERSFHTAQDLLEKGLRVAKARAIGEANVYLDNEFLPWWNQALTVVAVVARQRTSAVGQRAFPLGQSQPC